MNWLRQYFLTVAFIFTCVVAGVAAIGLAGYYEHRANSGQQLPAFDEVSLERTACYGFCPEYTVTVLATGEVRFEGRRSVAVVGVAQDHLTRDQMQRILSAINAADVFALRDSYATELDGCPAVWTDNPSAIIRVRAGERVKTIRHYLGCRDLNEKHPELERTYPHGLTDLEEAIDSIIDTSRWIK